MELVKIIKMCLNETYIIVHLGEHLSCAFPIQHCLKQGDALWSFIFSFTLGNAIRILQENQGGLELNVTHEDLIYADNTNSLGENINTIKENKEILLENSKVVTKM
jgi:hypothetical protein